MKKITLIAAVIVAASFASCKKDYTCTCSAGGGSNITKIIGVSKKTAQANCVTTKDSDGDVTTCVLSK